MAWTLSWQRELSLKSRAADVSFLGMVRLELDLGEQERFGFKLESRKEHLEDRRGTNVGSDNVDGFGTGEDRPVDLDDGGMKNKRLLGGVGLKCEVP